MILDQRITVTVRLLGREYRIGCTPEERDALLSAAELVNTRMQSIRGAGKLAGTEQVAVVAALNLAHDLLVCQAERQHDQAVCAEQAKHLATRISTVLDRLVGASIERL